MQQQMADVQAQLAQRTVEATSGGGMVKVSVKGDGTLASITINPQAINPADAAMLEDLVLVAVNSGLEQARELAAAEMGKVTGGMGGMGMPGLM